MTPLLIIIYTKCKVCTKNYTLKVMLFQKKHGCLSSNFSTHCLHMTVH